MKHRIKQVTLVALVLLAAPVLNSCGRKAEATTGETVKAVRIYPPSTLYLDVVVLQKGQRFIMFRPGKGQTAFGTSVVEHHGEYTIEN